MRGMDRFLAPLKRRILLMIGRAVVGLVNDDLKLQALQISLLDGEVRNDVERFQNYGLTSHPHPGAEGIAASVLGSRDHCVVIAIDDRRYRLKALAQGEVALYDDLGHKVHLTREGIIIDGGGHPVSVINTPSVELDTPLVNTTGNVVAAGDVIANGISLVNHVHGDVAAGVDVSGAAQ